MCATHELIARNLDGFDRERPSLLAEVHLLDWNSGRQAWPLPRPSMASAFAATFLPAYDPADWANNYERRAAAQQAERQPMADHYARLTKEQEERENREAREQLLRASARTASESPEACLRSKPSVSARPLTQLVGLRKGSGNASTLGRHGSVEADREISAGGIANAGSHKLARVNQTRESALPRKRQVIALQ